MKILILGLNYSPEKVGIAIYTAGMAEALSAKGHEVQVVAGQPYYPSWSIPAGYSRFWYSRSIENGVDVTRAPHYVPKNPTGARRVLHHASFALTSLFPMLLRGITWRPDVVLTVAPSLIAAPIARFAAVACGARAWLHIQDFEIDAAFATGLLTADSFSGRLAKRFEKLVTNSFHRVSSISPQMCAKLLSEGIPTDRVVEFRNWSDTTAIRPLSVSSQFRAEWNIITPHVALYSGNIANKQGIEIVVDAAHRLKHRKDLTFVVCGEGPNRGQLESLAAHLGNIQFHNLQPKERLNDLLSLASVHLLPQIAGAADLVLPSKLTNMLSSGRPIVATAEPNTGLYHEVEGCGLLVEPGAAEDFATAISTLIDDPKLSSELGKLARIRAEERWSSHEILRGLEERMRSLNSASGSTTYDNDI